MCFDSQRQQLEEEQKQIGYIYDVVCERHSRDRRSIEGLRQQISDLLTENAKLQMKYDDVATKYGLILSGSTTDYVKHYYKTI